MSQSNESGGLSAEVVARLLLTLEQLPAIVWTTDRDLRFTSSQGAGLRALGLEPNQVIGMTLAEYMAADPEAYRVTERVHRLALAGNAGEYERNFGDNFYQVHVEPLKDSAGDIIGCIGVATDVTARKEMERALKTSEAQLRTVTQNMPDQILEVNRDGTITYINHTSWGLRQDEVIGSSIYDWVQAEEAESARENLRLAFDERKTSQSDTYVDYRGTRYWFSARVAPHVVDDEVVSAIVVSHEITARKVAENALRERDEFLKQLGENLDQVLFLTSTETHEVLYLSPAFETIWGIGLEEVFANPMLWHEAIHPEDRDLIPALEVPAEAAPRHGYEYRIIRPDKSIRWIRTRVSLIRDTSGRVYRAAGVSEDITEMKQANERLAESQRKLREAYARFEEVAESIPGLLFQTQGNEQGELTSVPYVSSRALEYTGHTVEEIRANPHLLLQSIHPDDLPRYVETALESTARCEAFESEFRVVDKQGREAWLHVESRGRRLDDGGMIYSGLAIDVSDRVAAELELKQVLAGLEQRVRERTDEQEQTNLQLEREIAEHRRTEAALRENEQRFRELAENITEVFWLSDPDKNQMLYVSPAYEIIFQRSCQSLYDRPTSFLDQIHPDDVEEVRLSLKTQVEGNYERTFRLVRDDGELRWIRTRAFPVLDESGRVRRVAGLSEDITEQKRAQVALQQSHERFDRLVNSQFIGIVISDHEGNVIEANDAFLEMLGFNRDEHQPGAIHRDLILPPASCKKYERNFARLRKRGTCQPIELQLNRRNGEKLPVLVGTTLLDTDGERCLCIALDISERKKVERKQRREEKLLRRLLDWQEEERRLFAYDIHDGFVQDVVASKMILEGQLNAVQELDRHESHVKLISNFELSIERLGIAIGEGRRVISALRPLILDERGLIAAIDYLACELSEKSEIAVVFDHAVQFDRLQPLVENTVFRIVQEAMSNANRHSHGSEISITLFQKKNSLAISIIDNGIGFDKSMVSPERFGLRGIVERARLFGGKAQIDSQQSKGTRIAVQLPLDGIARRKKRGKSFSG